MLSKNDKISEALTIYAENNQPLNRAVCFVQIRKEVLFLKNMNLLYTVYSSSAAIETLTKGCKRK